jgi:tetratricopeptide (TPR) repeat protein
MPRRIRWNVWVPVLLILATVALYLPVRHFSFLNYDDPEYVSRNLHVRDGLTAPGVAWSVRSTESANWFPLTWISYMVDVQLFGLDPGLIHLTNVLLHAASAALLFVILFRTTGAIWRPAFVAAVFALHPLHVESVAWIAERKDVLCAFFWMLTLLAYAHYVQRPNRRRYALLLFAFVAGLMSKPMIVTLPVVMLLLDIWPLQRTLSRKLLVEKLPLFALSAAVSILVFVAQQRGGAVISIDQIALVSRLTNAAISYAIYALKLFWPAHLAVFYPFPPAQPVGLAIGTAAAIVAVSAWVIRERVRRPYLLVGWFFYFATLLPVIGIVQVGLQARADRYTYVPLIGLSIMLAWGMAEFGRRTMPVITVLAVAAVVGWAACARVYLSNWHDSASLFQHALQVTENNYVALDNLGVAERDRGDYADAISHFQAAAQLRPGDAETQDNLGEALLRQGQTEEALTHIAAALRLNPSLPEGHVNMGAILSRRGQSTEAATQYELAIQLNPSNEEAHDGLGAVLTDLGRPAEALPELAEAVSLKPDDADAHYNLGRLYGLTGRTAEAIGEFSRALELQPNDAPSHFNLGVALASSQQLDKAIGEFRIAVRLSPNYANAHANLGVALAQTGNCAEAVPHFVEALRLQPDMDEIRRDIAACSREDR